MTVPLSTVMIQHKTIRKLQIFDNIHSRSKNDRGVKLPRKFETTFRGVKLYDHATKFNGTFTGYNSNRLLDSDFIFILLEKVQSHKLSIKSC